MVEKAMELRAYQKQALASIARSHERHRSTLLTMATGLGKTVVFTEYAKRHGGRALVLAHRGELLTQATKTLERVGLTVQREQAENYARRHPSLFGETSDIVVASVQTLGRQYRLDDWPKDAFDLIILDECFPAGTLIDTDHGQIPIEHIDPDNHMVWSVDHAEGRVVERCVNKVMSRPAPALLSVRTTHGMVRTTENHPFFVKRGKEVGYIAAEKISPGDMLCVWKFCRWQEEDVFDEVSAQALIAHDGSDQPPLRIGAHEGTQPYAGSAGTREDAPDVEADRSCAACQDGEWSRANTVRAISNGPVGFRLDVQLHCQTRDGSWHRVPDALQAGLGTSGVDDLHRGGWGQPRPVGAPGAGSEEGELLVWSRVESIARQEPRDHGLARVYNLEVEGTHTYFADSFLVHNCHHAVSKTYRRVIDYFKKANVLGVTATPDRGDGAALAAVFDDVCYRYDLQDGIGDGWLSPIIARSVRMKELKLDKLTFRAGDFVLRELDEALRAEVVLQQIAKPLLDLSEGRRTIVFGPTVQFAHALSELLNHYQEGVSIAIDGSMDEYERRKLYDSVRDGGPRIICNVAVLTEGFDDPEVSCIAVARPTQSRALYTQIVGRGTRPCPHCPTPITEPCEHKPNLLLLDFYGVSRRHSLVGPADVLAGRELSDKVRRKARQLMEKSAIDPVEARLKAAKLIQRAKRKAEIKYKVERENAFARGEGELDASNWNDAPTPNQIRIMQKFRVPDRVIARRSRGSAGVLIRKLIARSQAGLCTFRQAERLRDWGINPVNVSFEEASRIIDARIQHYKRRKDA